MVDLSLVLDVSSSIGSQVDGGARRHARLHRLVRPAHDRMSLVDVRQRRQVIVPDAGEPRIRQGDASIADVPSNAARRQHADGRRALSRMGRAAIGAGGHAVGAAHHRAVHRRRVEQRPGELGRFGHGKIAAEPRTSRTTSPIRIRRPGTARTSTGSTTPQAGSRARPIVHLRPSAGTRRRRSRRCRGCRRRRCTRTMRSAGIPTSFPLQTATLKVNGVAAERRARPAELQRRRRQVPGGGLEHQQRGAQPPRDHRRRGAQRQRRLPDPHLHDRHGLPGAVPAGHDPRNAGEHPDAHLQRQALARPQRRTQLEGKYFYAADRRGRGPAFQGIQNEIVRLSK